MQDLIGRTLGHYRIVEKIGEGGMGEVYRATDERLDRDVAVKVLHESVAQDADRLARFEREAKAVAQLAHPNILEIWDFGRQGSVTYAVTELLDGENLRRSIPPTGMPWQKVAEMGAAIADGLAAAHGKGIVHRDVKPENMFVTSDGRVKILDFGLAQVKVPVEEEAETATLTPAGTVAGTVLGTMGYMSPEQLRGEPSDARSDIFAFGCVLYEMLSGQTAFLRSSTAETTAAILKEEPPSLSDSGTASPADLERTIRRCLEKSREARFQSASDLAYNLRSIGTDQVISPVTSPEEWPLGKRWRAAWIVAAAAIVVVASVAVWVQRSPPVEESREVPIPRIVVLPFENLGSPDDEYFADGMTEEITSRLSAVSGLQVISRTSAMQYKDTDKTISQIGDELNVQYALEGTVRWERATGEFGRVRITPQLINVTDDSHLWSDRYDRAIESVFEVQSNIAEQVVGQLHISLLKPEQDALAVKPTDSPEAYEAFLRGRHHYSITDLEQINLAITMYERAVELDPDFALAWAYLSMRYGWLYFSGSDRTPERAAMARGAAERALEADPDLPGVHRALGMYYYRVEQDYERALEQFSQALSIHPDHPGTLGSQAIVLRRMGRWQESVVLHERLFDASPRDLNLAFILTTSHRFLRNYDRALDYADLAIFQAPDRWDGYSSKSLTLASQGLVAPARSVLEDSPVRPAEWGIRLIHLDIAEKKYAMALARTREISVATYEQALGRTGSGQRALNQCACYHFLGDQAEIQKACGLACERFEEMTRESSEDPRIRAALGLSYAYLGRKEDALREGKLAAELLPVSEDALLGPDLVQILAQIYVLVGEPEAAVDQIEFLLSIPGELSVGMLRVHPYWDPLRDNPRFQALLEEYETGE